MIKIFVPKITNRIEYVFNLIFNDLFHHEFELLNSKEEYEAYQGPKFVYGKEKDPKSIFFQAVDLLFENNIRSQTFDVGKWNEVPYIFKTGYRGVLPYDPFAAIFYMVSRYEEYLPSKKDKLERYRVEESVAYQQKFLEIPVVNYWAKHLRDILILKFPQLILPLGSYAFHTTINIETPYAYKFKSSKENFQSLMKELKSFKFSRFMEKYKIIKGEGKDPYDTFGKIKHLHRKYNLDVKYFFKLPEEILKEEAEDKFEITIQELLVGLAQNQELGLFAHYTSNGDFEKLKHEKVRLETLSGKTIRINRQFNNKLDFPDTYQNLIELGIEEDFSMGYSTHLGFRAGIASSFLFYNLKKEAKTHLRIHPYAAMDSSLRYHQKSYYRDVPFLIKNMADEVKKSGGDFCIVFNNESISGQRNWRKWENVYEEVIKSCI